ncbi:MAG: ATP-binding cassette domain-containing protein [Nevskia sp.]|nr:ATP-binding cassette domain-containing protein [Nevskia sp.]
MIVLDRVDKHYGSGAEACTVFQGLSLHLPSDRRLAVLGAAGCGKSTFIRLLAGLEEPSTGSIERHARVSFPVGYGRGLKYHLSARQNLAYAARIYGADVDEVVGFVEGIVGLGDAFDAPLRGLGGQQLASVRFAMAYAIPFDTYLFDNFIAAGTAEFREKCIAMFEARAAECGIIMAVRDLRTARRFCDAALVLDNGGGTLFDTLDEGIRFLAARERRLTLPDAA